MHIDKAILKKCLIKQLTKKQPTASPCISFTQPSLFLPILPCPELIIDERYWKLLAYVIDHDPTNQYVFYGKRSDYVGLPVDKSLFGTPDGRGLPIGNLTSQLFANVYLDPFDKWMKYGLGLNYYGRYVDDFVIVHHDKEFLKALLPQIADRLQKNLALTLHPKKNYLQHISKGVKFLGAYIKPHRTYIHRRTIGNAKKKIALLMKKQQVSGEDMRATVNSYFGMMSYRKSGKQRKKISESLSSYGLFSEDFNKLILDPGA